MANPYTITVTFAERDINSESTPDTYDLILTFTVNADSTNEAYTDSDKNLKILDAGELTWEYDLNDSLLVPSVIQLTLSDKDAYLEGLLFGTTAQQIATEKNFKVEIQINNVTKFLGFALETSIVVNPDTNELTFRAAPQIDVLNKTAAYDSNGLPLDPIGS
jgi:hypothetical protein